MEIYKEVIIQAVIIFPVVAALFTMPYVLYNYHKYGSVLSCRATLSGSHKQHFIIANFSRKKAQSHLNDTVMPLFLHSFSSVPGY